ncbi:CLUMA_CG011858, isoform B [Gryllus bimaculatus]|nr:CLUMA_CG011858, isoform B [Gryllus bimaculatus]
MDTKEAAEGAVALDVDGRDEDDNNNETVLRSPGGDSDGPEKARVSLSILGDQKPLLSPTDIFTTLVDTQWRWTLLVFALSFILSWLGFATLWWLIAFTHGDLEPGRIDNDDWKPCVVALRDFASCFLFSIETQHTIGYGSRSTTEECPEAVFVMCLQSITGVMIQAFMVGIVFAKMSRPKQRTQTLLFSRSAVVCQRDGSLCLMFRVGDMRKSHIIGARVRAQLIRTRQTPEGETLAQSQCELEIGTDDGTSDLFFIWPVTVVHRINAASPLYRTSAADLLERERGDRFELVVILEGTIESTGQTTQARSSYLPAEIMWGHRFEPVVSYNKDRQAYEVNYAKFNSTCMVDTPLCSARELDDFYRAQRGPRPPSGALQRSMDSSPHLQDPPLFPHYTPAHLLDVTDAELLYLDTVSYSSAHESDQCSDVSLPFQRNGNQPKYKKSKIQKNSGKKTSVLSEDESLPSSSPKTLVPTYCPIVSNGGELEGERHPGRYSPQWQAVGNNYSDFDSHVDQRKKHKNDNNHGAMENTFVFSVLGADTRESNL